LAGLVAEDVAMGEQVEIGSMTVLPAVREDIELHTEDGLTLVGELATPVSGRVAATLITLHPLPTHGGFMDSHVLRKAAWRLPHLADIAVLRFNTRGTRSPRGASQGSFDEGVGEAADARAAVAFAIARGLPHRWLLGWSFGTELALMHCASLDIEGAILLSPPLHRAKPEHLEAWAASGKRVTAFVPEHDDFLQPAAAAERFAALTQLELVPVPGAKHLWVGEKYVRLVLDGIVKRVAPERHPLPTMVPAADASTASG
jgi:alpha/beta superfamily hydrolase